MNRAALHGIMVSICVVEERLSKREADKAEVRDRWFGVVLHRQLERCDRLR